MNYKTIPGKNYKKQREIPFQLVIFIFIFVIIIFVGVKLLFSNDKAVNGKVEHTIKENAVSGNNWLTMTQLKIEIAGENVRNGDVITLDPKEYQEIPLKIEYENGILRGTSSVDIEVNTSGVTVFTPKRAELNEYTILLKERDTSVQKFKVSINNIIDLNGMLILSEPISIEISFKK